MNKILTSLLLAAALSLAPGCASKKIVHKFRLQDMEIAPNTCQPVTRVIPEYPRNAKEQAIEGYAVIGFTLNHEGLPKDLRIIESFPPDIFGKTAKAAVSRNKYTPCLVAREAVDALGVREKIIFDLEQGVHYLGGDRLPFIKP